MVQGQLDDATEFGDLLELQDQIRALQQELAETKQADDEEIDRLLDQNGTKCMCIKCRSSPVATLCLKLPHQLCILAVCWS